MTEIILARGLPASGKSTWAQAWVAESPETRFRVNRDELRQELYGAWHMVDDERGTAREKEDKITQVETNRLEKALREGKDVVVDNTNLNPRVFRTFGKMAKQHGAKLTNRDFPIDINEAIRRNNLRDRVVPESVIHSMRDRYLGPNGEFHLFPGSYPTRPVITPDTRSMAIGVDLDGTLSDTRPIQHYINGKKYKDFDAFHRSSLFTKPNQQVVDMIKDAHAQGFKILITTARNEMYRAVSQKWLDDLGIPFENMYMRADGDSRPDYVVKKEIFREIKKHYDLVRQIDDNPQAVKAAEEAGVKVTLVPGFGEDKVDYLETRQIDNPFRSGKCIRCNRPLKKNSGPLGPGCAKLV